MPSYPVWLPVTESTAPIVHADFVNGYYWFDGAEYATFALWLTATSGTFARTPAGSYTNSSGVLSSAGTGVPRFDYDPVTLEPLGLLLEPAFSNAILRSETFQNAAYTATGLSVSDNTATSPKNLTTAATLTESGGTSAHEIVQTLSKNVAAVSVYAKAGTGKYLNIAVDDGNNGEYFQAIFDLSQGGITDFSVASTGTGTNSIGARTIESCGNGWYRCSLRGGFGTPTGTVNVHFGMAEAAKGNTFTNRGAATYASSGKTIYLYGAQVPGSPDDFYSYVPTTTVEVNGGGDILKIGSSWDNASNPMTFVMQFDTRGVNNGGNDIASAYYGVAQDSWQVQFTPVGLVAYHAPTSNTTTALTAPRPGVNTIALRADTTTLTMSVNGNAVGTTAVGSARTAATNIRLGGYETSTSDANAILLRSITGWASGLSNAALVTLSQTPGVASPVLASTIETAAGAGSRFIDFPAFCLLPSGYLLATYMKSASSTQDVAPTVPTYKTAATSAGPWSAASTAVANSTAHILLDITGLALLDDGAVLATVLRQNNVTHDYVLQTAIAEEGAPGIVTWSGATTITGSPFFTGVSGAFTGDATASPARKLASGEWMILLYGYLPGDTNTSVGAIFSSTPSDPTSWHGFTVVARGNTLTPARDFSEANFVQRDSGGIVVFARQDANASQTITDYWRVTCSLNPRIAANWNPPTFLAADSQPGAPDVLGINDDRVLLWTRTAIGSNQLIGYNTGPAVGPWPSNRAAFGASNYQYWYSQSQILPDGSVGTVLAQEGGGSTSIVFIQTQTGIATYVPLVVPSDLTVACTTNVTHPVNCQMEGNIPLRAMPHDLMRRLYGE